MSLTFAASDVPYLPRGVRVAEDRVRGQKVLLAPEKAVALDAVGEAILARVDGAASFGAIVASLNAAFPGAPEGRIEADVQSFLSALRARIFLMVK